MKYHSVIPERNELNEIFDSFLNRVDLLSEKKKRELSDFLNRKTDRMVDLNKLSWLLKDLNRIKEYVSTNASDGTCVDVDFRKGIITIDFSYMEINEPEVFWSLFKNAKLVELILIRENVIRISAEYNISVEL